jgi:hypothetical protein
VGLLGCSENDRSRLLPGRFTLFHDLLTFLGSSGREEGWFLVEREREEGEERRIMDEYSKGKTAISFLFACSFRVTVFMCGTLFIARPRRRGLEVSTPTRPRKL